MKRLTWLLLVSCISSVIACRSRVVQITLINTSQQPVTTIIVDYPGATFGVNSLAPGKTFVYKIKPQETGPLKIQFSDAQGGRHALLWPTLHRNQEGSLDIKFTQDTASVTPALR